MLVLGLSISLFIFFLKMVNTLSRRVLIEFFLNIIPLFCQIGLVLIWLPHGDQEPKKRGEDSDDDEINRLNEDSTVECWSLQLIVRNSSSDYGQKRREKRYISYIIERWQLYFICYLVHKIRWFIKIREENFDKFVREDKTEDDAGVSNTGSTLRLVF